MLLLASLGRHQICSSVSDSTHERRRGQYCSISFARENSRKSVETDEAAIFFLFRGSPPHALTPLRLFPTLAPSRSLEPRALRSEEG